MRYERRVILRTLGAVLMVGAGVPLFFLLFLASAPHMLGPMLQKTGGWMLAFLGVAATGLLLRTFARTAKSPNP